MQRTNEKLIAVIGATGRQGGAVVRALQASSQFKVRALTRNPDKHRELADSGDTRCQGCRCPTFVWSTLPNVEAISGGKFDVPHRQGQN